MVNSLLDKISRSAKNGIITKWQNGQIGEIVDLQNNLIYRFIDYEIDSNGNVWQNHLTEESERCCPIVATGFVAYWLHHRKEMKTKDLFEGYYNCCLKAYEQAHESDADAHHRDLKKEFTIKHHIQAERRCIEQSKAISAYLTDPENKIVQDFIKNYLKFARDKRWNLWSAKYPQNMLTEKTFFHFYQSNGGACLCIDWLRKAYNLPKERLESPTDQTEKDRIPELWKEYYEKRLPELIQEEFEDFEDLSSQRFFKNNRIMQEIDANLKSYPTLNERKHYIARILKSFKEVADVLNPIASINEMEQTLKTLQQPMDDEATATCLIPTGPLPMSLMSRTEMMEKLQKDIEFIKKQMNRFNELAAHQEPDHISIYFSHWIDRMKAFAQQLANVAARYGIDLMEIQRDCKVYLIRKVIDCDCYIPPQESHTGPIYITNNNNEVTNHYNVSYNSTFITNQMPIKDSEEKSQENNPANTEVPTNTFLSQQATLIKESSSQKKTKKKKEDYPPYTFRYYNQKNQSINEEQRKRVIKVFQSLIHWGWINSDTQPENFEMLFAGESVACHIQWIASSVILTHFLKALLVRSYIVKQKRCSVSAIMNGQFGKKPDHNANRISEQDNQKIDYICKLLDISTPLKSIHYSEDYHEVFPAEDLRTLTQYEVLNKNMRVRKSV